MERLSEFQKIFIKTKNKDFINIINFLEEYKRPGYASFFIKANNEKLEIFIEYDGKYDISVAEEEYSCLKEHMETILCITEELEFKTYNENGEELSKEKMTLSEIKEAIIDIVEDYNSLVDDIVQAYY